MVDTQVFIRDDHLGRYGASTQNHLDLARVSNLTNARYQPY